MGSGAFLVEACRQLGDELVKAWHAHGCVPRIPPDEDELLHARRLVAQRCLYGVDKNPMAVDLSKLSLWLATLAKDHPFTFLDHSLKCGDSLVGLTREQIANFTWELPVAHAQKKAAKKSSPTTDNRQLPTLFADPIAQRMARVTEYRQRILAARDDRPYEQLRQDLDLAEKELNLARLAGDLVIAAFFSSEKDKERKAKLEGLSKQLVKYIAPQGRMDDRQPLTEAVSALRGEASLGFGSGPLPVVNSKISQEEHAAKTSKATESRLPTTHSIKSFHWQIEFPEVFANNASAEPTGGFDAIVANPPFLGGSQLSAFMGGPIYQEWIKSQTSAAFGNGDISAYFFRKANLLVSQSGAFGFIATKTISEGGTRTTGLKAVINSGARIYNCIRNQQWPGEASVVVVVVHIAALCTRLYATPLLDGKPVAAINSRLHPGVEGPDPVQLQANDNRGFFGTKLGGNGFVIGPQEFEQLSKCSKNSTCLQPFLGGEEVNSSPVQKHERFAITFGSNPLEYAQQFPVLLEIVRTRVKPERDRALDHGPGKHGKKFWWQFTLRADPLYRAINDLSRCIVTAITTAHLAFSFQPIMQVFSHSLVVFAFDSFSAFCCLQSRTHEAWAFLLSSYLGQTLRYSVSDAFHTFPFPLNFESASSLSYVGEALYEFRAALMIRNNEGLTKTYNRFHDPDERSPDILELRRLHAEMDRAVLEAYGWHDLAERATCEFLLDYEDDEDEDSGSAEAPSSRRKKKKPWRYRWPDDFRDEVLARLLDLNQKRAEEERLDGLTATPKAAKKAVKKAAPKAAKKQPKRPKQSRQREMFDE